MHFSTIVPVAALVAASVASAAPLDKRVGPCELSSLLSYGTALTDNFRSRTGPQPRWQRSDLSHNRLPGRPHPLRLPECLPDQAGQLRLLQLPGQHPVGFRSLAEQRQLVHSKSHPTTAQIRQLTVLVVGRPHRPTEQHRCLEHRYLALHSSQRLRSVDLGRHRDSESLWSGDHIPICCTIDSDQLLSASVARRP